MWELNDQNLIHCKRPASFTANALLAGAVAHQPTAAMGKHGAIALCRANNANRQCPMPAVANVANRVC